MIKRFVAVSVGVAVWAATVTSAYAQSTDQCSDILRSGVFNNSSFVSNNFLRQIAYSYLKSTTYEQRNSAQVLGGTFPIGDIIIGAKASNEQFLAFQRSLENSQFNSLETASFNSTAISSADPDIITAWSGCMGSKSGLEIRFNPLSNTRSELFLRWNTNPDRPAESPTMTLDVPVALTEGSTFEDPNWRNCAG